MHDLIYQLSVDLQQYVKMSDLTHYFVQDLIGSHAVSKTRMSLAYKCVDAFSRTRSFGETLCKLLEKSIFELQNMSYIAVSANTYSLACKAYIASAVLWRFNGCAVASGLGVGWTLSLVI